MREASEFQGVNAYEHVVTTQEPLNTWAVEPDCLDLNPNSAIYELYDLGRGT